MIIIGIFLLITDLIEAQFLPFGVDSVENVSGVGWGFGFVYWMDGYIVVKCNG